VPSRIEKHGELRKLFKSEDKKYRKKLYSQAIFFFHEKTGLILNTGFLK